MGLLSMFGGALSRVKSTLVQGGSNVVNVYKSLATGQGISLSAPVRKLLGEPISKVIDKIASHPFASAAVVTGGITAYKAITGKGEIGKVVNRMRDKQGNVVSSGGIIKQETNSNIQANNSLVALKDNPIIEQVTTGRIPVASGFIGNAIPTGENIGTTKAKSTRRKVTRRKVTRRKVRHKARKLKFGSPAYRKKYLGKRHKKGKKHKTRSKLKFGSPAYRRKYLGHK